MSNTDASPMEYEVRRVPNYRDALAQAIQADEPATLPEPETAKAEIDTKQPKKGGK